MTALTIRPSSWDLALFVHVAGAMLVVAALVVAVSVLGLAWRAEGDERRKLTRFGFFTLLCAAIPAYIMMRTGAQWVLSKEGLDDSDATWIGCWVRHLRPGRTSAAARHAAHRPGSAPHGQWPRRRHGQGRDDPLGDRGGAVPDRHLGDDHQARVT